MNRWSILLFSRNSLVLLMAVMGCLLMVSCEKEQDPIFSNSIISGTAQLYWPSEGDHPNIKVVASGPYGQAACIAEDDGTYQLAGLGNGNYYLEFSQEGYGTIRQYGIQLFGNDTVYAQPVYLFKKVGIFEMPSFTSAFIALRNGTPSLCIETDLSRDDYAQGIPVMLFFSDQNDVSFENYQFAYPAWDYWFNYVEVPTIFIYTDYLPFESGARIYGIGYVCNYSEYENGYLDTYLGRKIYSTLDKSRYSNVISFIMP